VAQCSGLLSVLYNNTDDINLRPTSIYRRVTCLTWVVRYYIFVRTLYWKVVLRQREYHVSFFHTNDLMIHVWLQESEKCGVNLCNRDCASPTSGGSVNWGARSGLWSRRLDHLAVLCSLCMRWRLAYPFTCIYFISQTLSLFSIKFGFVIYIRDWTNLALLLIGQITLLNHWLHGAQSF